MPIIRIIIAVLIVGAARTIFARKVLNQSRHEEPRNNTLFEKHEFEVFDKTIFASYYIEFKPIARNVLKVNILGVLSEAWTEIWCRATLYKKYNTYQKYLIDLRDDLCQYFNFASGNNLLTKLLFDTYAQLFQSNFRLQCPIGPGRLSIWADRFNFSELNAPLMPAGRYRLDLLLTKKKPEHKLYIFRTYFSISDIRVWF